MIRKETEARIVKMTLDGGVAGEYCQGCGGDGTDGAHVPG